ncbi:MAG TPA: 3'-5' exonuclease [Desulfarculaceae bacterium]|nr:3'-5' exonuclease [Desulfarculaceae bacterium]
MSQTELCRRRIVFDFETTGLSPGNGDRVIEVGAVAIENGRLTDEFHSLIHTDREIHWAARRVHGITSAMLVGKPPADLIFNAFHKFISSDPLIAHNATFDLRFLESEFAKLDLPFKNPHDCTLKLSRRHNQTLKSHKLENVARHLLGADAVKNINLHRALDDARLTAEVWLALVRNGALS